MRTAPPPRHNWRQVSQRGRAVKSTGLGQANSGSENACLTPDYREQRLGRTLLDGLKTGRVSSNYCFEEELKLQVNFRATALHPAQTD